MKMQSNTQQMIIMEYLQNLEENRDLVFWRSYNYN